MAKSIITENDFASYVTSGFAKVTENTTIAADSWAWSDTLKAAHLNDANAALKGCFTIPVGFLKVGDKIRIQAEIMNVSGIKAKIALDFNTTNKYGTPGSNVFIISSEKTGEFEIVNGECVVSTDGYYAAIFGVFTADIGEYYIRNCKVEADTKYSVAPKKYKQGFRSYGILSTTGSYAVQSNMGLDTATLTVDSTNKQIQITHTKPFEILGGIPFLGESSSGVSKDYYVRTQGITNAGCIIKIYDYATRTMQDPALIVGTFWFHLFFSGYDYEVDVI